MSVLLTVMWALLFAGAAFGNLFTGFWARLAIGVGPFAIGRLSPAIGERYIRARLT